LYQLEFDLRIGAQAEPHGLGSKPNAANYGIIGFVSIAPAVAARNGLYAVLKKKSRLEDGQGSV